MITPGVAALGQEAVERIVKTLALFDSFSLLLLLRSLQGLMTASAFRVAAPNFSDEDALPCA